ncbi:hypothetical protein DDQ41_25390 [Streptomyces spongiicola]|uniref:Integrase n=1 Tax=Streptomyces spongiicola TaxID=1690221 RepID=A0ABM6VCA0_9ACTN|nr:hypothetical protein [Streptomyces spongiicola]AWK08627.1 hypothetical protein DDQ41_06480 [Streptomyces spongiicola]AWK11618.1 hypothetical protein DDQ41_24890 [Streptomyces spongiicola]AWK11697.1 hypothetical protein DDQ41_25390 [Streptomyces spongiicola]
MALDLATSSVIDAYTPREAPACWVEVGPLVKAVVTATVERVPYSVVDLLHVVARLAVWAEGRGVAREPAAWLKNETIDAFVLTGCAGLKPGTLRTYRTWLRRVREVLVFDDGGQEGLKLSAPPAPAAPYEDEEIAALRSWARQLRPRARSDALALMALADGMGLAPGEIARLRGTDIRRTRSGACVLDAAVLGRLLVAHAGWEEILAELAGQAGDDFLFRPGHKDPPPDNLIASFTHQHRPATPLPKLNARRLRASWIVSLMRRRIDPGVIAAAAGLASTASLARYQHFVPPLSDRETARLLRGQQ